MHAKLFKIAFSYLTKFQRGIIKECLHKKNGGISIPMGSGKTLITLVLSIVYHYQYKVPSLIIVSKTLLSSWENEIKKFFGKRLKYLVIHSDRKNTENFTIDKDVIIYITTPETLVKFYKLCIIGENYFIQREIVNEGRFGQHEVVSYNRPTNPFLLSTDHEIGGSFFYSIKWSSLIVDELQQYTNIKSDRAKALGSVSAENRWGLSGTMFNEPKVERILGYHIIINDETFPRSLPDATAILKSYSFTGIKHTLVSRSKNEDFVNKPILIQKIVEHTLSREEELLYINIQTIMKKINTLYRQFIRNRDTENVRKYGSYRLACIIYLRQILICPILPISSALIDNLTMDKQKSILCKTMIDSIKELNLLDWLNDSKNIVSGRLKCTIDTINAHKNERVIVFCNFSSCLKLLSHILSEQTDRNIYTISSNMSTSKRSDVIKQFESDDTAIFLLTFQIGSEGLNLQCAHTMILVDLWWNSGASTQAIARVMRNGQKAQTVNIYFMSSNTSIEKFILTKQQKKLQMLEQLQSGAITIKDERFTFEQLLRIIDVDENTSRLRQINNI